MSVFLEGAAMSEKTLRFGILGAGGVGGYFGAVLARAGADVVLIARGRIWRRFKKTACASKPGKARSPPPLRQPPTRRRRALATSSWSP